jgi:hypothetical protein
LKILYFTDPHQNVFFIKSIFQNERNFDHIIFGGDWFDTKHPNEVASARQTCEMMLLLDSKLGNKATWLLGNHDCSYAWALPYAKKGKYKSYENPFICSGHTEYAANEIAAILPRNFFEKFKMVEYREGILFSHAGVHSSFVPRKNGKYDVEFFVKKANDTLAHFRSCEGSELFEAGYSRGGKAAIGGPLWLDWNDEFEEDPDMPCQIVGHTKGREPRRKGKNFNLDCKQQWYAVIEDGEITVKVANEEKYKAATEGKTLSVAHNTKYKYERNEQATRG